MDWARILAYITGTVDQELLLRNEYLAAENRILKAQLKPPLRLTDAERMTLAEIAHRLGRKALEDVANTAKPDTIMGWYRRLIARKFDGSKSRRYPGRPRIDDEIEQWVVRMAKENSDWGYDRIVGAMANLGYRLSDQTVGNILQRHGIPPAPERKRTTTWSDFIRAHMSVLSTPRQIGQTTGMKDAKPLYHGYRFPPTIISHAVWLYHRFCLSLREVEDLLAERGIAVSYESIRQWCNRFGPEYARKLKKRQGRLGDIWHLDEVFIKINGELQYLWRAVDQDGDTIDILVQKRRNKAAAKQFFRKLLKGQHEPPWRMITDKLKSYSAAHRKIMPSVTHSNEQYENNRAEVSHEPTRLRERQMRRFKSAGQAQRFLSVYGVVGNLFRLGRHLTRAIHYREFRSRALCEWQEVTCAHIIA